MRPAYHYAPAANWLSDPNGLVFANGEWHLFYQYNPHGDQWGHMAWGHAVSRDLVEWQECAPALLEDERHLIFSGSAVVDVADSAGFGAGALVAIYTGASQQGGHQVQCLAASNDGGRNWHKFAGNPVLDRDMADFRDPNVFWHAPTRRWIMVVALSEEDRALVYASDDLKTWRELSAIGPFGLAGRVWECPLLIEVPVEGQDATRWLFKVDLLTGGPGSGAIALTGTFDGERFVADRDANGDPAIIGVDHGRDFYAAIAWHAPRDAAGRPCWIGWMGNHGYQSSLPGRGWRGAMSVPRWIGLRVENGRYRLVQSVEPAIDAAFAPLLHRRGHAIECRVPIASRLALVRHDASHPVDVTLTDAAGARVAIAIGESGIAIDRAAAVHHAFDAMVDATAFVGPIDLWLDGATLELASADGTAWASLQHCLRGETITVRVDSAASVELAVAEFVGDVALPARSAAGGR